MSAQLLVTQLQRDIEALKTGPEATRLAFELADSIAACDIETCCPEVSKREGYGWWYDTAKADADDRPDIEKALVYLGLRGRLLVDEANPHIVSILQH